MPAKYRQVAPRGSAAKRHPPRGEAASAIGCKMHAPFMNTARCRADAYFARHDERFPIPDVSVPRSAAHLGGVLLTIDRRIREGVLFLYTVGEELVAPVS